MHEAPRGEKEQEASASFVCEQNKYLNNCFQGLVCNIIIRLLHLRTGSKRYLLNSSKKLAHGQEGSLPAYFVGFCSDLRKK